MKEWIRHALTFLLIGLAALVGTSGVTPGDETAEVATESAEQPSRSPIRKTIPDANLRIPDEVQPCAANLGKLHAAVKKYEKDKGTLPDWLSDLVPDYLDDKDLLCPVHGKVQAAYWPDPKLPCSYTYEFSAGKLSNNWGAVSGMVCKDWKTRQVKLFGDVVPMVRCFHQPHVLSLSSGGQVFQGLEVWERVFMPDYQRGDELTPSERPFRYVIPGGSVEELATFIKEIKGLRPKTPYQILDHDRRAPLVLKVAATRILEMEKDVWSAAYQSALRVLLEERIRSIRGGSPAGQRETIDFVKTFLTAKLKRHVDREDVNVAMSAAKMLEDGGNPQLAAEAYREFAALLAASNDQAALDAAKQMEAAAEKLGP
jgi:hypothetical protein